VGMTDRDELAGHAAELRRRGVTTTTFGIGDDFDERLMQLLAVYATMQAFDIDAPLPAAGLVLVLMNVATIVPLWPGNIGLVQAAVALPLRNYGVPYATGFAFGLALQAIEMACGVGLGLIALAREGISFAVLRRMQPEEQSAEDVLEGVHEMIEELEHEAERESAPVPR